MLWYSVQRDISVATMKLSTTLCMTSQIPYVPEVVVGRESTCMGFLGTVIGKVK
jgi:hypothetical protein